MGDNDKGAVNRRRRRYLVGSRNWAFRDTSGVPWPFDVDFTQNRALVNGVVVPATSIIAVTRGAPPNKFAENSDTITPYRQFGNNVPAITNLGLDIEGTRKGINPNGNDNALFNWDGHAGTNTSVLSTDIPPLFTGVAIRKHTLNQHSGDTNCGATTFTGWALNTSYVGHAWVYIPSSQASLTGLFIAQEQGGAPWSSVNSDQFIAKNMNLRDQWQRIAYTLTSAGAGANNPNMVIRPAATVDGQFIYSTGWEFEELQGATPGVYPSSLILTPGSTVSRNNDIITFSTLPTFNASHGTLYAEFVGRFDSSVSVFPGASLLSDGTNNNRIDIHHRSVDDNVMGEVIVGNATQFLAAAGPYTYGTIARVALTWANNDFAVVLNGGAPATSASGSIFTPTQWNLGMGFFTSGFLFGKLRRTAYHPSRLPNALLQSITTAP